MQLHKNVRNCRKGKLSARSILLHDNVRVHTVTLIVSMVKTFYWEVNPHPAYFPDLSSCDYQIFGNLKKFLQGKRFNTNDEVKAAVKDWTKTSWAEFLEKCLEELPERWKKCINRDADYVEH